VAGPGRFSFIHLISVFVLVMLPVAVWQARTGRISGHRRSMQGIFLGGLVIAGALTFVPPRIMGRMIFGL